MGDNRKVKGFGKCKAIVVTFQGITIVQNFLPFKLGGVDIILGVDWLSQLGEVRINWGNEMMKFLWEGKKVEVKGDMSITRLETSLKILLKSICEGGDGYWIKLGKEIKSDLTDDTFMALEITELLKEFE